MNVRFPKEVRAEDGVVCNGQAWMRSVFRDAAEGIHASWREVRAKIGLNVLVLEVVDLEVTSKLHLVDRGSDQDRYKADAGGSVEVLGKGVEVVSSIPSQEMAIPLCRWYDADSMCACIGLQL
jgi:hypothetical protein